MKLKKTLLFGKIPFFIFILFTYCIAYIKDKELFIFMLDTLVFIVVIAIVQKWIKLYFKWLEEEQDEARRNQKNK